MAEAKAKVLALVSEGMPVQRAMEQSGQKARHCPYLDFQG
jgi:hypothetical protein